MLLAFSNPGDGLLPVPRDGEQDPVLLLGREAPVDGYRPVYRRTVGMADSKDGLRLLDDPCLEALRSYEGIWFRVRAEVDEETGEVLRARHGKIDGTVGFAVRGREAQGRIGFVYYLSPDNSRSVEWNGESLVEGADLQAVTEF
jgi:hypothetical protein